MELDLGIEVSEVNFDEFERRKASRGNNSIFNEIQKNAYFADKLYQLEQMRIGVYSVIEEASDQFERRKAPR
ncbi:MAG: hypothetical protein U1C48_04635 [Methylotenera sp.]|nr:hypothetical protein [Methylotenera sp.]